MQDTNKKGNKLPQKTLVEGRRNACTFLERSDAMEEHGINKTTQGCLQARWLKKS